MPLRASSRRRQRRRGRPMPPRHARRCAPRSALRRSSAAAAPAWRARPPPPPAPVEHVAEDRDAAAAVLDRQYLQLHAAARAGAQPAEQAEIAGGRPRTTSTRPPPSHAAALALILGTPGHPGTDPPQGADAAARAHGARRRRCCRPSARVAFLELSQLDRPSDARGGKRSAAGRGSARPITSASRPRQPRLQAEIDENARLRKELDEAHAKLDAIANIERYS